MCTADLHINRLREFHTVPKGITALLSILYSFRVKKIIAVYYDSNSKHLNNAKPQECNGFCIVQTGLVSGNYDSAGGIREILTL
jgi:hypothetical protein